MASLRKHFHNEEFKERGMMSWNILGCLLMFVLPSVASGDTSQTFLHVKKGDNITFPCSLDTRENVSIHLRFEGRAVYHFDGVRQYKDYKGRLHMSGTCDLTLQELRNTDAGKYVLSIFYDSDIISNTYTLSITAHLTGQKGRELELVDVLPDADRVEYQNGSGMTEVWKREQGVLNDRLTENSSRLAINDFRSTDAGTYRVLTAADEVLITVIVSYSGSNDKLNGTVVDNLNDDTQRNPVWVWIGVGVGVVFLAVLLIVVAVKRDGSSGQQGFHEVVQMEAQIT